MDLKRMLERYGWRVIGPVATVQAALRLLEDELPSVALLDVNCDPACKIDPLAGRIGVQNWL
jgi:hypothetical protein